MDHLEEDTGVDGRKRAVSNRYQVNLGCVVSVTDHGVKHIVTKNHVQK